jgi:hypothetical protein
LGGCGDFHARISLSQALEEFLEVRYLTSIAHKYGKSSWATEHSWLARKDGWRSDPNGPLKSNNTAAGSIDHPLRMVAVVWLMDNELADMDTLPSREEIFDRSKASPLVKLYASFRLHGLSYR